MLNQYPLVEEWEVKLMAEMISFLARFQVNLLLFHNAYKVVSRYILGTFHCLQGIL